MQYACLKSLYNPHEYRILWVSQGRLNSKDDYAYRYPSVARHMDLSRYHFRCQYVEKNLMRYYDIRGREMPCCFIKDASKFVSSEHIADELTARRVPDSCTGCRQIFR